MLSVKNTLRVNNYLNKVNGKYTDIWHPLNSIDFKFHLQIDVQLNILNPNNELHSIKTRHRITILFILALFSMILMLSMLKICVNFFSLL